MDMKAKANTGATINSRINKATIGVNDMPPVKPTKRPTTSTSGVKMLISAASVAATIGGWALIGATTAPVTPPTVATQATQLAPTFSIKLEPLPTLVPPPARSPQLVTVRNQTSPMPRQQTVVQAPAQPAMPALRVVNMPSSGGGHGGSPAPAATTRSSR